MAFNRRIVALAALVLLSGSAMARPAFAAPAAGWVPYVSADFGIRAEFPVAPTIETARSVIAAGPITRTSAYTFQDGLTLMVWMTRYDEGVNNPQAFLKVAADSVQRGMEGPELSRTALTIEGSPALEVVVGPSPEGDYARARLIVRGNVLYQVSVAGPVAPTLPADARRFFDSFRFVP